MFSENGLVAHKNGEQIGKEVGTYLWLLNERTRDYLYAYSAFGEVCFLNMLPTEPWKPWNLTWEPWGREKTWNFTENLEIYNFNLEMSNIVKNPWKLQFLPRKMFEIEF